MNEAGLKYIENLVKELDIKCAFEHYRSVTYTRVSVRVRRTFVCSGASFCDMCSVLGYHSDI